MSFRVEHGNTGEAIPDDEDRANWLPIPPNRRTPAFTLGHLPTRWDWIEGTGWLPSLTEITHRPGCNGCDVDSQGRPDPRGTYLGFQSKGGTVLMRKDRNIPGGDYLRRHRCADGTYHYSTRFESYVRLGNRVSTRTDTEGLHAWLLSLVTEGLVEPMAPEVFANIIDREQSRLDRVTKDRFAAPGAIEAQKARVEAMTADYERQFGEAKPKARRAKKAPIAGETPSEDE